VNWQSRFHEEQKRRENERKQELVELERDVFNLPDIIEHSSYTDWLKEIEFAFISISNIVETDNKRESITERLATSRQSKFTNLWDDLLTQIAETNQVISNRICSIKSKRISWFKNLVAKLEDITRKCNHYYENGDRGSSIGSCYSIVWFLIFIQIEIDSVLENLLYRKEITSLKINTFQKAFKQLDQILPLRLATIQQFCQSIEELESERIQKVLHA